MFSGKSVSATCSPAGLMVQPFGSRKPRAVGPAKRGASSARAGTANRHRARLAGRMARRFIDSLSGGNGVGGGESKYYRVRRRVGLMNISCGQVKNRESARSSRPDERQGPNRRTGRADKLQRDAEEGKFKPAAAGEFFEEEIFDDVDALLGQQVNVGEESRPGVRVALGRCVPRHVVSPDRHNALFGCPDRAGLGDAGGPQVAGFVIP